ncbi:MAG: alkaline phosphatase family protein [Clostridiales bacterium]|nr:alkaline phosphatase family protein [Clostridiales bacterium]
MTKIIHPDYDNSIVSVSNSILKHYGAKMHHASLPLLDNALQHNYKNVVLLVFDGLGTSTLQRHLPKNSFLRKHMTADISSVYPSTTVSAITSIITGQTPNEHGWIGWSCYFKEVDQCIDMFTGNISNMEEDEPAAKEHIPHKYLGSENICTQISKATHQNVRTCMVSPFSSYRAHTCDEVCAQIKTLCNEDSKTFIYAYHFQPDHDMHEFGTTAACITTMLESFDDQLQQLADTLKDTLLIITADHGLVDVKRVSIDTYPQINECLALPVTIESRCCSFTVKDEYKSVFAERFNHALGDKFLLMTHDEFIDSRLLGDGTPHKKTDDFIGDFVAIAVSDISLWNKDNHGNIEDFKASHAGLTTDEMRIPLIVISC